MALPTAQDADKILVLLQQGDEVLDYRAAHRYYSSARPPALLMTEANGSHGMDDFAEKIPLLLQFLSDCIKGNRITCLNIRLNLLKFYLV